MRERPIRTRSLRLQTAIEYLTTYMWAIIILIIILAAITTLGVFNPFTFSPRASAGSCTVSRPNGPYTDTMVATQGGCGILPETVAVFGASSQAQVPNSQIIDITGPMSASVWVQLGTPTTLETIFTKPSDYSMCVGNGAVTLSGSIAGPSEAFSFSGNQWYFITVTTSTSNTLIYVNGAPLTPSSTISWGNTYTTANFILGGSAGCAGSSAFSGKMANLQLYNTTLDPSAVNALYMEGIGGAPIYLPYLTAWWPLNGDVNDYSGDNVNGNASTVTFTSAWTSTYSVP